MVLIYFILLILVFLGLYIGLLVGYFTEEELKPGRKYFEWIKHLLFIAILVVFFVKNPSRVFVIAIGLLLIIFSFSKHRETLYYYALAIIFFLAWRFNGFGLIAPLMFLYGFPIGSIYLLNNIKEKKKKCKLMQDLLYHYAGFLVVGVILGLLGLFL